MKRKGGLFKKAHELAVLCSVDVAVIIFGQNKKLYEYSSCDMHDALGRYQYVSNMAPWFPRSCSGTLHRANANVDRSVWAASRA